MGRKTIRGLTLIELLIAVAILFVVVVCAVVGLRGCDSEDGRRLAVRTAQVGGLRDVRILGEHWVDVEWYGCSKSDGVVYEVQGIDGQSNTVQAMVCCGGPLSFKACTLRVK